MNTQRWLALGILALIGLCLASSNVWLSAFRSSDDEEPEEPAIAATATEEASEEDTAENETAGLATLTPTPTEDPVVGELMEAAQMETLGVGDDPFVVMDGSFTTIDTLHRGEGTASIYEVTDNLYVLRLEPFSVVAGPDLQVVLSTHDMPRTSAEALLPTYLDLGPLQSTEGSQNYSLPEGTDISPYKSVVIYSSSLNIIYTTATLTQVRGQ
jgi:hypothetical protein